MAETVTVTIVDGDVKIATRGFKGKSCLMATAELEKALGKTTADQHTPEMRETATQIKTGSGR